MSLFGLWINEVYFLTVCLWLLILILILHTHTHTISSYSTTHTHTHTHTHTISSYSTAAFFSLSVNQCFLKCCCTQVNFLLMCSPPPLEVFSSNPPQLFHSFIHFLFPSILWQVQPSGYRNCHITCIHICELTDVTYNNNKI